jgi:hypothetical protein
MLMILPTLQGVNEKCTGKVLFRSPRPNKFRFGRRLSQVSASFGERGAGRFITELRFELPLIDLSFETR